MKIDEGERIIMKSESENPFQWFRLENEFCGKTHLLSPDSGPNRWQRKGDSCKFLFPSPSFTSDRMWSFLSQFEANCQKMLDLAETNKISLRAQTKTHKTVEGGVLQVWHHNQLSFSQNLWTDGGHKKEDCHLDPGGDRDVRGRGVRGHPLRIPVHRRASGSRLEAQGEAGRVPFDGLRGAGKILF